MYSRHFTPHIIAALVLGALLSACGGGGGGGGGSSGGSLSSAPVAAPVITSGLVVTALEGSTGTVYTASATVASGHTATYSISGTDAGQLTINSATGALSFKSAPSFGAPTDANADNEYLITLTVSDGTQSVSQPLSVQVTQNIPARSYSWSNATWGGGGFISGLVYHPTVQNLLYARTDVGGAYRWNATTQTWTPLNDDLGKADSQLTGVLSLALDPNDGTKLYLATGQYLPSWGRTGAILRSSDQGATWSRTELPIHLGGNSDGRNTGERLVVDPNKGSILFLGTSQDGLWKSTDSGVTWAQVPTFSTTAATTFVLFDRSSAGAGGASQTLYVGVATTTGTSLYRSQDGGVTWGAVSGEPTGLMPLRGDMDAAGNLYLTYADALGPNGLSTGAVYRLNTLSGGWANITPQAPTGSLPFGYAGVSVDHQHPGTLVVSTLDRWNTGDTIFRSTDNGATWTDLRPVSTHAAPNNPWVGPYYGGSIGTNMGHWMSAVEIDPFNSANMVYNTGYGLWMTGTATSSTINWSFNDAGLEETVITDVTSTNAGAHLLMTQGDVAGGRYTTLTTSDVNGYFTDPNVSNDSVSAAELNPNMVVRTSENSFGGYISSDNGVTWSHLGSTPVTGGNTPGHIALSAQGTSMVWVPNNQGAYYSTDGGATWHASTGYPTVSGQYFAPVADRAADGYFYTFDYATGTLYESSDGGKTFAATISGLPTYAGGQMISLPGIASARRQLIIATSQGLYQINGANVTAAQTMVSAVQEAYLVAYGAPAPGPNLSYTLFVWGKVGGVVGLYRIDANDASNPKPINDALHQFGYINAMSGDPRVYGRVYLGTGGRGLVVGNR